MTVWLIRVMTCVSCLIVTVVGQAVQTSPFYCNLSTLSKAERERKEDISGTLAKRRLAVREIADGFEFVFPGDRSTVQLVSEWVDTERLCCPFFDFAIQIDREGGKLALRLTGREGTKEFIKADFTRWISR